MKKMEWSYVKETCKIGKLHDCCRYLAADSQGFCCLKLGSAKAILDKRVEEKSIIARADNCKGFGI